MAPAYRCGEKRTDPNKNQMNQPIPTEFQHPPDEDEVIIPKSAMMPQEGPSKEATLTLRKKEGHCILELARAPGPQNMVWTQNAGSELDDALEKARKVWKFSSCVAVSQEEETEVWTVTFSD